MTELQTIIANLERNNDVDAAFLTGSLGTGEAKPHSDVDLVVILRENKLGLYACYR